MKKTKFLILFLLISVISVKALSGFFIDSSKLAYTIGSKSDDLVGNFSKEYKLSSKIDTIDNEIEKEITKVTKKVTSLLFGDFNNKDESSEKYYKRYKDYLDMMYSPEIPKDESSFTGYDESSQEYKDSLYTGFALPQMFDNFNELDIMFSSYGDIHVDISDRYYISMEIIRDVTLKNVSDDDASKYERDTTDLVIYYMFIKYKDEYKLYYVEGEYRDDIEQYINWLSEAETKGGTALSARSSTGVSEMYNHDKVDALSQETLNLILNSNINKVVVLSAIYNSYITSSANGFFIRDGLILTTWSFLEKALSEGQTISISDGNGNSYVMDGVVTINPDTDVAVIKLTTSSGVGVNVGDSSKLNSLEPALTLSSKTGAGFLLQKGVVVSSDGYIQTTAILTESDQGSPVLDQNGNVIGMNTAKQVNSGVSFAINSDVIKEIQEKFKDISFDSIKMVSFNKLKENFYQKYDEEEIINSISKSKWKEFSKIGNIEKTIQLDLIKASYEDGIVSLRYLNKIPDFIDTMRLSDAFVAKLLEDGYEEVSNSLNKQVYKNNKYKVIIMKEFDYLIVVMVKL